MELQSVFEGALALDDGKNFDERGRFSAHEPLCELRWS